MSRSLKVVCVTVRFPVPSETFAGTDMRALARAGVGVRVMALRGKLPGHDRMVHERGLDDIPIETSSGAWLSGVAMALANPGPSLRLLGLILRHSRTPAQLAAGLWLLPAAMRCFARIRRHPPDVVHLFWGHYPSLVGFLVRHYLPNVALSHFLGAYDLELNYGPAAPVVRSANAVFTHAEANRPRIEALGVGPSKLHVVYRGIEIDADDPHHDKAARHIVAAGRLLPVKAFPDALAVLRKVCDELPDATMTIAGDGPERPALEALARRLELGNAVRFVGHVAQTALFDLLEGAAVLLVMSRSPSERLPNVAKEAALRGCVTVAARSQGIDELFADGEHARFVAAGDVASASAAVIELLTDESLRTRLAGAARERIVTHFDVDRQMGEYIDVWEKLVVSGGR